MKARSKTFSIMLLLAVLLGVIVVSQTAVAAETQQQQAQFIAPRLVVNASFLNVRTGPGVQYPVLITVVGGTELPVLARATDNVWFQVSTVIGVGWVNVQYTVPRGSFDNVPVVRLSDVVPPLASSVIPSSLALPGLGQGGGGGVPAPVVTTSSTVPATSGTIRLTYDGGRRAITVAPGERFRAVINVEAVNVRTLPQADAPSLGTVFRDDSVDYPILGSSTDRDGVQWLAIEVIDVGIGWVEAPKIIFRLSRVAGTVVVITADVISMTDSPGGGGEGLPVLTGGQEAFLTNISRDSNFVQIELGGGTRGWVPFNSVITRTGTPTDLVDLSQIPTAPSGTVSGGAGTGTIAVTPIPSFGLDIPHVVVNTGFLNVRSGPGVQFTIVATVPGGTELPVLGMAPDRVWYFVQGPWGQGWLNSELTLFRGSIATVPIIRAVTGDLAAPVAVVADAVALYAAPGTNFGVIGTLSGPIEVPIVARTADNAWVQLNTSVGFGWVVANQVLLRGDLSLIPIVG